jgi:tetratricopeptide (TPR) repeat protein
MKALRHALIAAALLSAASSCKSRAPRPQESKPPVARVSEEAPPSPRATTLDDAGKLTEAIGLYEAQAERTKGVADRLRYARALLRSGQDAKAKHVLDAVAAEPGATDAEDGKESAGKAGVVASSLLSGGFPELAVDYAKQAAKERDDPRTALLLLRSLVASGAVDAARREAQRLAAPSEKWEAGPRYELARSLIFLGDAQRAEKLLSGKAPESVGELFRGSVLANLSFSHGDWERSEKVLSDAEKSAPADLGGKVARHLKNARRELLSIRVRRAVALVELGKRAEAVAEANQAKASDEEPVRTAAVLLLASNHLSSGRRTEAFAVLDALAGHDRRLGPPIAAFEEAVSTGAPNANVTAPLENALVAEDASAAFLAKRVCEILARSVRAGDVSVAGL